jgi:hypothetical protein
VSAGRRADAIARYLNALTEPDARAALLRCCGSRGWVERMLAGRPFADDATLFTAAERVWWSLEPADRREAFAAHPRIGERAGDAWARAEQAGMAAADTEMRRAFIEGNRAYEERFDMSSSSAPRVGARTTWPPSCSAGSATTRRASSGLPPGRWRRSPGCVSRNW